MSILFLRRYRRYKPIDMSLEKDITEIREIKKIAESDIFKPATKEEVQKRHERLADRDDVDNLLASSSSSTATFEDLQLTVGEVVALKEKRRQIYFSMSGGHLSGEWSSLEIIHYDKDSRIIYFKYKYGCNGDPDDVWQEECTGQFDRNTQMFTFDYRGST